MHLAGRVALVTGASSGIGRATALRLVSAGAQVLVHGRDRARTEDVARQVGGAALLADLAEPGSARELAARASAVHGRLDVLVANAGIGGWGPFPDLAPVELDRILAVDLVAPLHLVHAVLPDMVQRGSGHLVLMSSVAGRTGVAGEAAYAAAKAGLDLFAESARLELAGTGVGVTTVLPGLVHTPFFDERGGMPVRRVPRPVSADRVARAVVDGIAHDRAEVWIPRWLRIAPMVRALAPGSFRGMSGRFGQPARSRRRP